MNVTNAVIEAKFPFLETTNLTRNEKDELIGRLENESEQMNSKFASLVVATGESLEANVPPSKVILYLNHCYPGLSHDETISSALSKIKQHCTFFNYDIIKAVINEMGKDQDRTRLLVYEATFKEYCKCRLCEIPIGYVISDLDPKIRLCVKTDKIFFVPAEDVNLIKTKLSTLLKTTLVLLDIKKGCIELVFGCFDLEYLEHLQDCDHKKFQELDIIRIYTDDHVYYEKRVNEADEVITLKEESQRKVAAVKREFSLKSKGEIIEGYGLISYNYECLYY